jgi:penicillin-binding protein 2
VSRPRDLAKSVVDWRNIEVVEDSAPEVVGEVVYPTLETYAAIYRGLEGVTTNGRGTATDAFRANPTTWPTAGKTGTAEVDRKADTSVFVGFGPAGVPEPVEYAVSAILPQAGFGADAAAPLVFSILAPLSQVGGPEGLPEPPHTPVPGVQVENTATTIPTATTTTLPTRKIIPIVDDELGGGEESAAASPLSDLPRQSPRIRRSAR